MITKTLKTLAPLTFAAILMTGCSVGDAPGGMSPEAAKANFENAKPEDQIKMLEASPAPPAEKKKRIDEIKRKAGMPVDDAPAAPAAGGPPPGGSFPGDPRSSGK